jgi:uncharacterized protein YigA (DUF484 family)
MKQEPNRQDDDKQFEHEVVRYLRDRPEFFERHLDLLADMILPHDSGTAISLLERQLSVLRDQRDDNRKKLNQLIITAQKNETLNNHINELLLDLLDASNLEEVIDTVVKRLANDIDAEAVVVRLFDNGSKALKALPDVVDWSEPVMGAFEKVIKGRRPVCGSLKPGQLDALFSDQSDNIRSAALIPLIEDTSNSKAYGLLAIGSPDHQRFRADMGTVFLTQLGKVLTRILKLHLV